MALRLRSVPARQGVTWVREGFRVFLRHPMAFSLLYSGFLFAALVVNIVPLVGSIAMLMAVPVLGLAFMRATQASLQGGAVHWPALAEPLAAKSQRRRPLLILCAIYAATMFALMATALAAGGDALRHLQELFLSGKATPEQIDAAQADPRLRTGLWLFFGGNALAAIPFWHAPALVQWCNQGVAQALFSSTLACWRNKGAFAMYGLTWFAVVTVFGLVLDVIFSLLGAPQMAFVAAMPAALMFVTAFYVSLYFTFIDSFELTADGTPAAG
jgi:hypothetical protein